MAERKDEMTGPPCRIMGDALRRALDDVPRGVLLDLIAYKYGEYGDPASDDQLGLADALDNDLAPVLRRHGRPETRLAEAVETILGD